MRLSGLHWASSVEGSSEYSCVGMVTAYRLTTRRREADKGLISRVVTEEPTNTLIPVRPTMASTIAESLIPVAE